MRRLAVGVAASAGVGVVWALSEIWDLRAGGLPLATQPFVETLVLFALLGVVFALPGFAAAWAVAARGGSPRVAAALPGFAAGLAFIAILANVRFLPRLFALPSLAADAGMLLAALGALALFARRPWRRRSDLALLAAGAVLSVGAWIATAPERPAAAPAPLARIDTEERPPDVFLILVDTLRADHLGAYGYARPVSQRIDALAAEGFVLERAFSTTNWTRPAVASLFTSTMPSRHAVTEIDRAVPETLPLLAESLQARGYQTAFFAAGVNVEPSDGYQRGLDHFSTGSTRHLANRTLVMNGFVLQFLPWTERLLPWGERDPDAATDPTRLTARALGWIRTLDAQRPVFGYLHFLGPHSPYRPPPAFDRFSTKPRDPRLENPPPQWAGTAALDAAETQQMIDLYDGEVLWNDTAIGDLIDGLRAAGRLEHAVVIVVADHGEAFGGNGVWGHNASGFGSVVRIPLVVWASPSLALPAPARISAPASLIDVGPTILDLAGQPAPGGFDGESLVPLLRAASPGERVAFVENPNNDEIGVRTSEWDYFEGKTGDGFGRWLFAAGDTEQRNNLAEREPAIVERLRAAALQRRDLDRGRAGRVSEIELDEDRRRMLEELGYLTE